jgi:hypothetical protein
VLDDKTGSANVVFPDTVSVPPTAKLITAKLDDISYIYISIYKYPLNPRLFWIGAIYRINLLIG